MSLLPALGPSWFPTSPRSPSQVLEEDAEAEQRARRQVPKAKLLKQFLVAEGCGSASLGTKLFTQELKICFSIASPYTPRYSPIKNTVCK